MIYAYHKLPILLSFASSYQSLTSQKIRSNDIVIVNKMAAIEHASFRFKFQWHLFIRV